MIDTNLAEMLTAREQLMEDIDSICESFFSSYFFEDVDRAEDLTAILCDAVCKNFPAE